MDSVVESSSFVDGADDAVNALDDIDNGSETTDAEDEEEITSNDSGHEEKSEKDDVDGREKTEHEVAADGKKDGDGRENTSDSADQDSQTKKSKKGKGKTLKKFMAGLRSSAPTFWKTTYKLGVNFEASNEVSNQNDGKGKAGKTTSTTPNDEDQKISSADAAKLRKENKRLRQQLEKLQDEHTQLETRIRGLSEVESQLIATQSFCVKLKEELHESQSSRENLIAKMSTQSEEQRVEVNRLNVELKKVTKYLAKIEDEDRKNVESLQITKQDLDTMTSLRDKLNLELREQEESHRSETSRLIEQLNIVETEKNELTVQHRKLLMGVESQLIESRSICVKLTEELRESQSSRENLIAKMYTQSEEQRVEVNRLDAEHKKITKDLAKLEQDKQSIEDKDRKNVESLQIMKQDLDTMTSLRDKLNLELIKQEESHRSETSRLTEKLESVEKEKNELTVQHREQLTEAEMEIWRLKEEIKELEYEAARLKAITGTIEANPSTSATVERGTGIFPCPVCGEKFATLPDRALHAKGCVRYRKYC